MNTRFDLQEYLRRGPVFMPPFTEDKDRLIEAAGLLAGQMPHPTRATAIVGLYIAILLAGGTVEQCLSLDAPTAFNLMRDFALSKP